MNTGVTAAQMCSNRLIMRPQCQTMTTKTNSKQLTIQGTELSAILRCLSVPLFSSKQSPRSRSSGTTMDSPKLQKSSATSPASSQTPMRLAVMRMVPHKSIISSRWLSIMISMVQTVTQMKASISTVIRSRRLRSSPGGSITRRKLSVSKWTVTPT